MPSKAVILFSGGLDSTTVLAIAKENGYSLFALSFDYGQRHRIEIENALKLGKIYGVKEHKIAKIDLRLFGGSSLTDDIEVPKNRKSEEMENEIPITYVPARNTIFLSYAIAYAEVINADYIYIGVNAVDYSGYPDCRPEYIKAFEKAANLGTKRGISGNPFQIKTPIIKMTKEEIIKKGISLNIDYSETHSCYDPSVNGLACGICDSCIIRKNAFDKAGITDPTKYEGKNR